MMVASHPPSPSPVFIPSWHHHSLHYPRSQSPHPASFINSTTTILDHPHPTSLPLSSTPPSISHSPLHPTALWAPHLPHLTFFQNSWHSLNISNWRPRDLARQGKSGLTGCCRDKMTMYETGPRVQEGRRGQSPIHIQAVPHNSPKDPLRTESGCGCVQHAEGLVQDFTQGRVLFGSHGF